MASHGGAWGVGVKEMREMGGREGNKWKWSRNDGMEVCGEGRDGRKGSHCSEKRWSLQA